VHGKELHEMCSSANIVRTTMSKRTRVAGYAARMSGKIHTRLWLKDLKERDRYEDTNEMKGYC
jgi:hypothetical protein